MMHAHTHTHTLSALRITLRSWAMSTSILIYNLVLIAALSELDVSILVHENKVLSRCKPGYPDASTEWVLSNLTKCSIDYMPAINGKCNCATK